MANKLAIVTGASSGIGFELAKVFSENDHDLVIAADEHQIFTAAEQLATRGTNVTWVKADLATFKGCVALWGAVEALDRPVDIVALNAGLGGGGLFAETDLEKEIQIMRLNVESTVHIAKYAVRKLLAQKSGRILITSSLLAELVAPREAVYAATKAFGRSFAKSLRYELKESGVSVTVLQPGPVNTSIFERADLEQTKIGDPNTKKADPYSVAIQAYEALMKGEEHVYAGDVTSRIEGSILGALPDGFVARLTDKLIDTSHTE